MIGKTFSHYKITGKLGEGGMGEVYRAEDTKLGRQVAVKVLPAEVADDAERLERFTREAQAIAALNHPNIVTIHSVEEAAGQHLLTMELVEGESLDQVLPSGGFGVERLFTLATQIADALAGAHDKGITHRDLKPANVMVTKDDRIKVLDFGLAKLAESEGDDADTQLLTQAGMILGTVPYMSPEQVQGQPVDPRSDIFSLGILLYEMATGTRPFHGENSASVISSVLKDQPPAVTEIKDDLPNHLGRIVRRCLEKSPNRRFQSAREVQLELEGLERELNAGALTTSVSQFAPQVAPVEEGGAEATTEVQRKPSISPLLAALIGIAGIALGGLLVWSIRGSDPAVPAGSAIRHFDLALDPPPSHRSMALSPDGQTLIYSGLVPGSDPMLFVRELDGFESRPIAGTEGGVSPFFSPDQQQIGFFSAGRLKRVSLLGGLPVVLCSTSGAVSAALWTEQDEILYATITTVVPHRVSAVDGGEGQPVPAVDLEPEASLSAPRLLPGVDNTILVTIDSPSLDGPHVGVLNLEDGRWKTLVRGRDARYLKSGHLLFAQEDRLVYAPFDADRLELTGPEQAAPLAPIAITTDISFGRAHTSIADDGTLVYPTGRFGRNMLFRLDRDGRLAALDVRGRGVRVSPDGRRLASWTAQDILVHDFDLGETNQLLNRRQSWYPVWSRDGERIFFSDLADGYRGVFEISSNGGDRQTVVTLDGPSIPTSIAPDGTIMGYRIHPESNRDIWTFSPAGELSMVLATRHNERAGAISPDGSWFAYVSDEEGGDEIYLRQFPDSGRKWRVSPAGGVAPVWSRDGGELLYRLGDLIYAISIERSGSAPRIGTPSELYSSDRVYIDRFGNPTLDTTPDGSIILPLTEPSDVRTRVVLNWQP